MSDLFATPWTVSQPGCAVHGIFQARILEWVALSFSRKEKGSLDTYTFTGRSCFNTGIRVPSPRKPAGQPWLDCPKPRASLQAQGTAMNSICAAHKGSLPLRHHCQGQLWNLLRGVSRVWSPGDPTPPRKAALEWMWPLGQVSTLLETAGWGFKGYFNSLAHRLHHPHKWTNAIWISRIYEVVKSSWLPPIYWARLKTGRSSVLTII